MKPIHYTAFGFLLLAVFTDTVTPTCVLESDFGFKINCAFKKAGLFRVRNLGGVKAHASIGFSLGDELGFEQSLTNQDPSRRRSVSVKSGVPPNLVEDGASRTAGKQEKRGKQNRIMMRPPPLPPSTRVNSQAVEKLTSLHRRASTTTMEPIVVSGPSETPSMNVNPAPKVTMARPFPMGVPPFKPLPPKEDTLKVLPITASTKRIYTPLQIPQSKGPGIAYQSEKYPRVTHDQVSQMVSHMTHMQHVNKNGLLRITPTPVIIENYTPRIIRRIPTTVHPFIPMPIGSPSTHSISIMPAPVYKNSVQIPLAPSMISKVPSAYSLAQNSIYIQKTSPDPISNFVDPVPQHVHQIASQLYPYGTKKVDDYNTITGYSDDTTLKFDKNDINEKIAEIAKAGNISMEAVEAAIVLRQQQLLNKYANIQFPELSTTTTTTTTTTTEAPLAFAPEPEPEIIVAPPPSKPKRVQPTSGKVMNAPREYYPVGYEKNFDDQFQSKVDLPDTNFHCGDQKYFPGLYGDENLGCMVFHVCALTDDGLVMKSFLCPESTLFDQTILKCNWWFYVDCKSTRKLYDTNIPVSKSYQLMKALTFFSSYKKDMQDEKVGNPPDMDAGIKEAITILENHNDSKTGDSVQIVTPQPAPVYRSTRNFRNATRKTTPKSTEASNESTTNSGLILVTLPPEIRNRLQATSTENISKSSTESNSKERQYRRRQTLKKSSTTTTSTTTPKPIETTTSSVEIIQLNMQPIENILQNTTTEVKQEKLTDQLEEVKIDNRFLSNLPEIKRYYRSSAEVINKDDKEVEDVGNEKVQIVRPTSTATLVGEFATPTAAIAKLDEAILGRTRQNKEIPRLSVVTAERVKTEPLNTAKDRT